MVIKKSLVSKRWDAMRHPTLPFQLLKPTTIRVVGHYHATSILSNIMDTMRLCPRHTFVLSSNIPDTVLSAPDNCLVMLRENVYEFYNIKEYLVHTNELNKPAILNVFGSFSLDANVSNILGGFDWFVVSGYQSAYLRAVIRNVHYLKKPCYVEVFGDTVNLNRMPSEVRCRELPPRLEPIFKEHKTWLEEIESLFI